MLHVDDTSVRILELMDRTARQQLLADNVELASRSGLFTTGIVATGEGRRIALFISGPRHAGENLCELLRQRAEEMEPPIQMCDALSRNTQPEFDTILANCLAHGRRNFVNCHSAFPDKCEGIILSLRTVYKNDAATKTMSADDRLAYHQRLSQPVMAAIHQQLTGWLTNREVEPNSRLGGAVNYMLNHWDALTLFLREPGAPLDNNICERALKRAIVHRKNSLFFKTRNGALVGDCLMSLIYTCEINQVSAFDYLNALQEHAELAKQAPQDWLPWAFQSALPASLPSAA